MSIAIQKRSRGVSVKRPSRSSAAANATEWTSRSSCPPNASPTSAKTRSRSASSRTSHDVISGEPTDSATSRTFFSIRSPWNVKASDAPPAASRLAIAHAIERLFATPRTRPRLPENGWSTGRSCGTLNFLAPPTRSRALLGGARPLGRLGSNSAAKADQAPSRRRAHAAADAPRGDPGPRGPRLGPRDGAGRPEPAAARDRAGPRAPCLRYPPEAELAHHRLARLPRPPQPGAGRGGGANRPRDSAVPDPGALPDPPRRSGAHAPLPQAAGARATLVRPADLPQPSLPPRHEPHPGRDPRRRALD